MSHGPPAPGDPDASDPGRVSRTTESGGSERAEAARALEALSSLLARWRSAWPAAVPLDALDEATLGAVVASYERGASDSAHALAAHLAERAVAGPVRSAARMLGAWFSEEPVARALWERDGPRAMALMAETHALGALPAALLLRTALELRYRWAEGGAALSVSGSRDLTSPILALTLAGRLSDALMIATTARLKPGVAQDALVCALADDGAPERALEVARAHRLGPVAACTLAVALVKRGLPVEALASWDAPATELGALVLLHRLVETGRKGEAKRLLATWNHRVRDPESPALLVDKSEEIGVAAIRWAIELPSLPGPARAAVETLLANVEGALPDTGPAAKLASAALAHLRGDLDVSVFLAEEAAERDGMFAGAARTLAWMGYPDRAAAIAELAPAAAQPSCLRAAATGHVTCRELDAAFQLASRVPPPGSALVVHAAIDAVAGHPEGRLGPVAWWPRRAATQA